MHNDAQEFITITVVTSTFQLFGGTYGLTMVSDGSVNWTFSRLAADATTWVSVLQTSGALHILQLPPGSYRIGPDSPPSGFGATIDIVRIPA